MNTIAISPEAYNDLANIKEYLDSEFGESKEKQIMRAIFHDLRRLEEYPNTDIKLFERFGVITDYRCIYTNRNYAFYRVEGSVIRVIRVLNVRQDFMYTLFGIRMTSSESEEFWGDE